MRYLKQWAFTAWWAASVLLWALTAAAAIGPTAGAAARQFHALAPIWGAPWALPLAAIRALGPASGVPFNFEIALALGLAACLLLDLRLRARRGLATQAA
ncbi:MAG TPA: hypothetical protein VEA99_05220 [Gemmatimonadaceae bacterium]|nr:hypothetical protein [Gemmatimonadaceae bacterium]